MPTYVQRVADYVTGLNRATLPRPVAEKLQACVLYGLGMALAGYREDDALWRALVDVHPPAAGASVLVHGTRLGVADAAFVNAALMCVRGQNDTFAQSFVHGGCVALPAVLALAEANDSSGTEVLMALAAGYEVLAKLAVPASARAVVARGLRATSVFGPLCSAAASARLLRLTSAQTAHALALATQFAAGTMQCWAEGTPEWRLQVGHAARSGVLAALAAQRGVTAAAEALEGRSGFYNAFCGGVPALGLDGWHTPEAVFKPFPGCLINQGPVYLLSGIVAEHKLASGDVARVAVRMSTNNAGYPGTCEYGPFSDPTGAVMSAAFMLEAMLRYGELKQHHYDDLYGAGPLHAASRRVNVVADAALPVWGCVVTVTTADGRAFERSMEDQQVFAFDWDPVVRLLRGVVDEFPFADGPQRFVALAQRARALDGEPDVRGLIALCTRGTFAARATDALDTALPVTQMLA